MTFQQWIEEDFGGAVETPDQKAQARYGSKKAAYDFGQGEMLSDLRQALGWQGGTVAQALEEVRRLRADAVQMPDWSTLRPDVVGWIPVACYRDKMGVICQWDAVGPMRPRPVLGQGVAALLPDHGEAKP